MPGSSNTSFIPKRNPTQKSRQDIKQQVFIGSFVIKILFFASLIAAGTVFVYQMKLEKDLETEVRGLEEAIASFNEEDMNKVVKMDLRLKQASERRLYSASIVSIFKAVQDTTTITNRITELNLERVDDTTIEVEAGMETGTYDSVLVQRRILEEGGVLEIDKIEDLTLKNVPPEGLLLLNEPGNRTTNTKTKPTVTFLAKLKVDIAKIPHSVVPLAIGEEEIVAEEEEVTQERSEANQDEL